MYRVAICKLGRHPMPRTKHAERNCSLGCYMDPIE